MSNPRNHPSRRKKRNSDESPPGAGLRFLRHFCDPLSDAVLVVNSTGRVRYANKSARLLTGFTQRKLLTMKLSGIFPALSREQFSALWRRLEEGGNPETITTVIRKKDEPERTVELAVTTSETGKPQHVTISVHDRASGGQMAAALKAADRERKEVADVLMKRVEERSNMLSLLHEVTVHCHESGNLDRALEFILREFCRFDGWCFGHAYRPDPARPDELLAMETCYEEAPGRFRSFRRATRKLHFKRGQGLPGRVWKTGQQEYVSAARFRRELRTRYGIAKDPGIMTAAAFPVSLKGEVLAVFEFFSDQRLQVNDRILEVMATIGAQIGLIEQRTRTEGALRNSEARLRRLVDSNIAGVFIADIEGTVREANPAMLTLLGFNRRELSGGRLNWRKLVPPEFAEEVKEILVAIRSGQASDPREIRLLRKDGSRVPVLAGMAGLENGAPPGEIITFVVDLSEIRRLEQQLLEVSDHEKQRLGQDLHDGLSQQISGIKFQMESLARALRESSSEHADRANEVVSLLTQAEQSAHDLACGLLPMHKGKAGLAEALEDLTVLMEQLYHRRCRFKMPRPVSVTNPQVAMHLYRIAQEAAGNAMKHAEPEEVTVSILNRRGGVVLTVEDDGLGMPAGRPVGRPKSLGLHIMHYRAGMIDARLQVQSNPGSGTIVSCSWSPR